MRIQFEVSEDQNKSIESLMDDIGIKTKKEFFNTALAVFEWAVKEKKSGKSIASIDDSKHTVTEVIIPVLSKA